MYSSITPPIRNVVDKDTVRRIVLSIMFLVAACTANGQQASTDQTDVLIFRVPAEEIERVHIEGNELWLRLNASGRERLQSITANNLYETLQVDILGQPALRLTIVSEIDSGGIRVRNPSDELQEALKSYLVE